MGVKPNATTAGLPAVTEDDGLGGLRGWRRGG